MNIDLKICENLNKEEIYEFLNSVFEKMYPMELKYEWDLYINDMSCSIFFESAYFTIFNNLTTEQLNQDYIIGLKARGMKQSEILLKHVLPHVFTTLSSLLGLSIGHLLGGTAIIETIFSYQGLGNMVVEAIRYRDYPIIQAYAIYMALIYVFVNLFVDIFQQVLNPRLRRRFNEKKVKN